MHAANRTYHLLHRIGSLLLILALVWLSVCTPFVYAAQLEEKAGTEQLADCEDDAPLTNTNEEKAEGGLSMPQEYLHEPLHLHHPSSFDLAEFHRYAVDDHVSYHPEFVAPPPEGSLS
ncbi:hypothetical protein [Flaviaesturariibacter amylovorans]|uniref:Transmembrane protein n=1 Tax=Flaviaesturariibacter amylovorans TaxID=1084520 RepID=A0ABP8G4C1_9BACT